MWGVGCILVEMIAGVPCFPGVRDVADQLDKIFRVTGTPDPRGWPELASLPHYKPETLGRYRPRRLSDVFPRLADMPHAESLANRRLHVSWRGERVTGLCRVLVCRCGEGHGASGEGC